MIGPLLHRALVLRLGLVGSIWVARDAVSVAKVETGLEEIRLVLQGLVERVDGFGALLGDEPRDAEVVPSLRVVGAIANGLLKVTASLLVALLVQRHHAVHVEDVREPVVLADGLSLAATQPVGAARNPLVVLGELRTCLTFDLRLGRGGWFFLAFFGRSRGVDVVGLIDGQLRQTATPKPQVGLAQQAQRLGVVVVDTQRLDADLQRLVVPLGTVEQHRLGVEEHRVLAASGERHVDVAQPRLGIAIAQVNDGQQEDRAREGRVDADRFFEARDGVLVRARSPLNVREVVPSSG